MKVCIVGASGKVGRYMVQHYLDRGYEVAGFCREKSVGKLDAFRGRIALFPGATDPPREDQRDVRASPHPARWHFSFPPRKPERAHCAN